MFIRPISRLDGLKSKKNSRRESKPINSRNLTPLVAHIVTPLFGSSAIKITNQLNYWSYITIMMCGKFLSFSVPLTMVQLPTHTLQTRWHDRSQFVMRMIYGFMKPTSRRYLWNVFFPAWWRVKKSSEPRVGLNSGAAALLKEDLSMSTQQHISLSSPFNYVYMMCNFFPLLLQSLDH